MAQSPPLKGIRVLEFAGLAPDMKPIKPMVTERYGRLTTGSWSRNLHSIIKQDKTSSRDARRAFKW